MSGCRIILLRNPARSPCRKSATDAGKTMPRTNRGIGYAGYRRNDQPKVRVRPKRLTIGLIGWKYVTGEATLQLVFWPDGN
jgi:hypothetical protein